VASEIVELISSRDPLPAAVDVACRRLRATSVTRATLLFDIAWNPTMEVVPLIEAGLRGLSISELTLIHPSAAMAVIATALSARVPSLTVLTKRSIYDEPEDEETDATESNLSFQMERGDTLERFVRTSIREAHARAAHRFALVFHEDSVPSMSVADTLVEELLPTDTRELGLIHPNASLDAIGASVRLRLANIKIAIACERNKR
jgi:hypothetical protein